jgi:hypothetical protein
VATRGSARLAISADAPTDHSMDVMPFPSRRPRARAPWLATSATFVVLTLTVGAGAGPASVLPPGVSASATLEAVAASRATPQATTMPSVTVDAYPSGPSASDAAPTASATAGQTAVPATPLPTPYVATPGPSPVAAAPSTQPGTPPPPQAGCTRTFGGDGSGSTDVAGALQDFVDDAANGSVLCLVAGATYRVDAPIRISHRSNLTLDGHGARLRSPVARDNAFITVNEGSGIALRNLVIEGANAAAGTSGALDRDRQHGHAFALEAVRSVLIEDTTVRRVFGDFVYVGTNSSLVWSDGVTIRNNDFALNGRMGVAVVAGRNVVIAGNSFDKVGMFTLDIEPNRYSPPTGGDNIEFSGNWVGSGTHTNLYGPLFFGALGSGNTTNVRILNNTLAGQALRIWVDPLEDHYVRRSFTISGNVSSVPMAGPAMRFTDVDGVTVTNNTQPLSSGQLVTTSGSTNVTISGNDITP